VVAVVEPVPGPVPRIASRHVFGLVIQEEEMKKRLSHVTRPKIKLTLHITAKLTSCTTFPLITLK
jgi:hypothetical protein